MGFFDFLKPKKKTITEEEVNPNAYLLAYLRTKLNELGHATEFSTKHAAIIVNSELEIATAPMPGDFHPLMFPVIVITIHKEYFPTGIVLYMTGLGDSVETKVASVADEYIHDIFSVIFESVDESKEGSKIIIDEQEAPFEIFESENVFQGTWSDTSSQKSLLTVVKDELNNAPLDQELNSLKMYIGLQENGELSFECSLNNKQWDKGLELMEKYVLTWKNDSQFKGQKQFVMLKRSM